MKHLKTIFACLLMAVLSIGQVWAAEGDELYSGDFTSVSAHSYTKNKTFTLSEKSFKSSVSQVASSVFYLGTNTTNANKPKGVLNNNSDFSSVVTALKAENATYNTNYETASAYALLLSNSFSTVGNIKYSWAGANGAGTAYIFADSGSGLVKLASTSVSNGTTTSGNIEYSNTSAGGMSFNSLVFVFLPNSNDKNIRLTSLVIKEGKASGGNPTCATPTFSPAAGNVVSGQTVTIASATEGGASIYYTMGADPADPTASSTPYTTPISITGNTTIKAIAIKDGYDNSSVATATYTALTPLITMDAIYSAATTADTTATDVAITFNNWVVSGVKGNYAYVTDNNLKGFIINQSGHGFVAGNVLSGTAICKVELYSGAAKLSALTSTTEGLTVTTGGTAITQVLDDSGIASLSGANTGSVIKINGECTKNTTTNKYYIAGVQLWNNLFSYTNPVEGKNYHCTGVYYYGGTTYGNEIMPRSNDDIEEIPEAGAPEAPTFSPAAGTYTEVQNVTLSCATDGATIYYTTNGDTPDDTSTPFTSAISVDEDMTIKAIAYKAGVPSTVTSAIYTINLPEDENVRKTWNLATDSYVKDPEPTASLIQWTATYVSMTNEKTGTETGVNNYIPTTRTSTRFYGGNRLTITPSGKQLTTIVFTATSSDYATAFANSTWTNATASASGSTVTVTASGPGAVVASVGGTCGFTAVQVNYTDVATKTVTITTPSNGTLVVKNAGVAISSGDAIAVGTTLTIVATPDDGYTLGSVSVVDADEDPVTVTENAFVVPSKNVTVSATFNVDVTPDASLTLWENGNEVPFGGSHKQGDHVTLPTSVTHNCANRVFVGWSAVEVAQTDVKPSYFEPGADFVLSAEGENTLYAVYAAVVTPAGYEKLASDEFETTATYVIGAEQASGNTTMWYFSSYSNTNVNINWGVMTDDPATTAPITFTLSGTASELVAQDAAGNYLAGLNTGKFKMSTTSTTVTLSDAGIIGTTNSYVLRHNYNGGNGGLRWYSGTTGTSAYFYKVIAAVYNKYSTTCDAPIDAPVFTLAEGTYTEAKDIEITTAAGATIYYTMTDDGTDPADPTTSSNVYSAAITLDAAGTYKFKAFAVKDAAESDIASATYTINLPLTTMDEIFAKADAVGTTATDVTIVFDNWVVSSISTNGKNVYLTDGSKGLVIFDNGGSLGFSVGDILSGTVDCKVQKYNGFSEVTTLTSSSTGLTVTTGGVITPIATSIDALSGVNTGAPIIVNNVKFDGTNLTDGTNNIQPYTTLYDYTDPSSPFQTNRYYNVTGIYTQFNAKKEILPRSADDIEELTQEAPTMTWYTSDAKTQTIAANAKYSIDLGDDFAPVFETNSTGDLTYSSSNTTVAEINETTGVLTLKGVQGETTITCAVAAAGNYTAGSQGFILKVREGSSSDNVVILAQYNGTWYAMKNTGISSKTADALEVVYSEGKIWNLSAENKAAITWKRTVDGEGNVTFQYPNDDYLKNSGNDLTKDAGESGEYQWTWNDTYYRTGSQTRTFLYREYAGGFKNFAVSNAGTNDYSTLPVITSAVFEDGVAYTEVRSGLIVDRHYTVCLPKNITAIDGATFWNLSKRNAAGTEAYLESVDAPEAGKPYIIQATKTVLKVVYGEVVAGAPVENGALRGTFTYMTKSALNAINVAPNEVYMLFSNELRPIGTENFLNANRAYVLYNELEQVSEAPQSAPGKRVKGMPMQPKTATGIEDLNASEKPMKMMINGQIFILRGEKMYDTTGRLVK